MYLHIKNFFDHNEQAVILHTIYNFISWSDKSKSGFHLHLSDAESNKFKKVFHRCMEINNKCDLIFDQIHSFFEKKYSFKDKLDKKILDPWAFKYPTGQQLSGHLDVSPDNFESILSFIFYLNEDYTGGEFFAEKNGEEILIKPRIGDLIVLDNAIIHGSKKVISGNKYIGVFQLQIFKKDAIN